MSDNTKDPVIQVIRKRSEIMVNGELYISKGMVESNDFYSTAGIDDLVATGKVRAFQAHGILYYCESDLKRVFPVGFVQSA